MTGFTRLETDIEHFARVIDDLKAIAERSDPGRRSELIALRRQLAQRIADIRSSGLRAFADPTLAGEFRSRLSHVLHLMALHQAKWPAVSIDEDNAAYRWSARQLADANRAFIEWTRAEMARNR